MSVGSRTLLISYVIILSNNGNEYHNMQNFVMALFIQRKKQKQK